MAARKSNRTNNCSSLGVSPSRFISMVSIIISQLNSIKHGTYWAWLVQLSQSTTLLIYWVFLYFCQLFLVFFNKFKVILWLKIIPIWHSPKEGYLIAGSLLNESPHSPSRRLNFKRTFSQITRGQFAFTITMKSSSKINLLQNSVVGVDTRYLAISSPC